MFNPSGAGILTRTEIDELNKDGYDLDSSGKKLYALGFALNDKQNNAIDPLPFKVSAKAIEKIVRTGIGRPWIPMMKDDPKQLHVRPEPNSTAEQILEYQKDFAGGEIVAYIMNNETNNAWYIVEIFPEYHEAYNKGLIKPFLSPMIGNWKQDPDTGEVVDGEIIHVHSVGEPGYDPDIAQFVGSCQGKDFKECLMELKPLAAAGKLSAWRDAGKPCPKNFLNTIYPIASSGMPATDNPANKDAGNSNPSLETVTKDVESLKQTYSSLSQEVSSIRTITEAIAAKMGISTSGEADPNASGQPAMAAAGKNDGDTKGKDVDTKPKAVSDEVKAIQAELDALKKEAKENKEAAERKQKLIEEKERRRQARIIAAGEVLLDKSFTEDKRKEREEFYFNLKKTGQESLQDLAALADNYESRLQKLIPETEEAEQIALAAAGGDDYNIPEKTEPNYDAIESSISGFDQ